MNDDTRQSLRALWERDPACRPKYAGVTMVCDHNGFYLAGVRIEIASDVGIALARDAIAMHLIGKGYHRFEWDSQEDVVQLHLYDITVSSVIEGSHDITLDLLISAMNAVLDKEQAE